MADRVVAFVGDLMDRSRVSAAVGGVEFLRAVPERLDATVVVVDLARHEDLVTAIRAVAPSAWIVGFAPHVDDTLMARGREAGADAVLPRSRFFRDVTSAIART